MGAYILEMHKQCYPEYSENVWFAGYDVPYFKEILENKQDYTFYSIALGHIYKDESLTEKIGKNYYLVKYYFKYVKD